MLLSGIIIYDDNVNAKVFHKMVTEKDPTALYETIMKEMLTTFISDLLGKKESLYTTNPFKADTYKGKTREVLLQDGTIVYLNVNFSTKAKWANVKAVCKLVNVRFELGENKEDGQPQPKP